MGSLLHWSSLLLNGPEVPRVVELNWCSICNAYVIFTNHGSDSTTAGDWDCVAAVERLPALHQSVGFIFLSFGIMGFIVEL